MEIFTEVLQSDQGPAVRTSEHPKPLEPIVSAPRYERKFAVRAFDRQTLEMLIKSNPALFRSHYPPRFVNNIYLDTPSLSNFAENRMGIAARTKVRIRWYGALFGLIERPILEFKIKEGHAGQKISYPLISFSLDKQFGQKTLQQVFLDSALPDSVQENLRFLEPSLLNRYRRSYFLSADRDFRLTIDDELTFWRFSRFSNNFLHRYIDREQRVIELKYAIDLDERAGRISQGFPFRMSRFSKYVDGLAALYDLSE